MKKYNTKVCITCKNSYEPTSSNQRFCSKTCYPPRLLTENKKRYAKTWRKKNKEYAKNYHKNHKLKPEQHQRNKDHRLKRTYGISLDEWYKLFEFQGGVCAICGKAPVKILSVDHKHQPKERQIRKKKEQLKIRPFVRGLLCWPCNSAIAKFRDNPVLLRSAADYLDNPPAKNIIIIKDDNANFLQQGISGVVSKGHGTRGTGLSGGIRKRAVPA